MSETTLTPGVGPTRRRTPVAATLLAAGAVLLLALVVFGRPQASAADAKGGVDIVYMSVTGEGATAKAWYDGAPSPGVPVQDALNKFAKEGYHVAEFSETLRATVDSTNFAFVILLERPR